MRLICADELMKAMYNRAFETDGDTMWQSGCWVRYRAIEQVVKEQPTIEERKKGKWLRTDKHDVYYQPGYKCSVCGVLTACHGNYCTNCGADMRETT